MIKLTSYFIILNMLISIIAVSGIVGAQGTGSQCGPDGCPTPTPSPTTPNPATPPSPNVNPDGKVIIQEGEVIGGKIPSPDEKPTPGTKPTPNTQQIPDTEPIPDTGQDGYNEGQKGIFGDFLGNQVIQNALYYGGAGAGLFGTIGALAGGDKGAQWGAIAGAVGGVVVALAQNAGFTTTDSLIFGLIAAGLIFAFTYEKESTEITEFYCLPWQAPIGGADCERCNEFEECSEYTCRSLGQACQIINSGTEEQKCVWQNPGDVNSPTIKFEEVSKEHQFRPDNSIRPPATGVIVKPNNNDCIKAFFPLSFKFTTNEPAQCKIDYNLTTTFESMNYYVDGNSLFVYNHTETLSLPGPEALNAENPELKNDGEYTLFVRCQDANGNFNQDAFSVNFCVEKGPDTTPPIIAEVNIPSGNPVRFNQSNFNLEVYVNEPSECKWSRTDQNYDNMEQKMNCDTRVFQMNNKNLYTCRATLTGIQDRKNNDYFFRCKDQPFAVDGDRNVNTQSYKYTLVGTQPLNILEINPNETIKGAADVLPVFLEVKTDNGHDNGNALCYYYNDDDNESPAKEEDYVLFHETKNKVHIQRQDLASGSYTYYIKCIDLGGNADYDSVSFNVETDRTSPKIVRVYKDVGLKVITDEKSECSYSTTNCNFEIDSGIAMSSSDNLMHNADWELNKNYYVRCKDKYDNEPFPNTCSIIVRPSQTIVTSSDDWKFDF